MAAPTPCPEEASLQRSQQLRELYESLSAGETNPPTRRPCASLSPEDLTESEWFYLMCVSFSFPPGVGAYMNFFLSFLNPLHLDLDYSIFGKLYHEVKNVTQQKGHMKSFTKKSSMKLYDHDMKTDGFEKYTKIACEYKHMYGSKLFNLMDYYGIETEVEIIRGNILKMSKSVNDRKIKKE
ncbi:hypothetical protein RYX36_033474 [Vicia faba]